MDCGKLTAKLRDMVTVRFYDANSGPRAQSGRSFSRTLTVK